jgi:hypothetical protein
MSFAKNHLLHFLIILFVLCVTTLSIWKYLYTIEMATYDASRLSSGRLIVNSLEGYQQQKGMYPQTLLDLQDFIFPIPKDPQTQDFFKYESQGAGYVLRIPQHEKEDFVLKK